ncbi:MAG: response regulator transcription factor [Bacteroidetes bacterium]|nr:response regulator transcription factor [Bacteroidota bacterium]
MIRILIVEDHPAMVEGLRKILSEADEITTLDVATNASKCMAHVKGYTYDVILLDIMLPGSNGLDLCSEIIKVNPEAKILALSTYNQRYYIETMLQNGAKGYLLKNNSKEVILHAIKTVYAGNNFLCEEVKHILRQHPDHSLALSRREIEVLRLIADGLTNKDIADKLFISPLTVDSHRKNLIIKLGAKNTASLIKIAMSEGFVSV